MKMQIAWLLVHFGIAFTIAALFFPVQIKLLHKWEIFDDPVHHKIHTDFRPSMGGVCIMLGLVFSLLIGLPLSEWMAMKYFFVALAVIFFTGLRDDILTLDPARKLIGQVLPVIIVVVFGSTLLTSFYDMSEVLFPVPVSWLLTIFTIIILTNAYNLIDGIDGLAGSISLVMLLFLGSWFAMVDRYYLALVAFATAGGVSAFLMFNWQPSSIFMGDTGTLSIGLILSFLVIAFINQNFGLAYSSHLRFHASIGTAVSIFIIPIFDTLRVILVRLASRQSPFKADRNHLHHQFLKMGWTHKQTTLTLAGLNIFFIGVAYILRNQPDAVILPLWIVLCVAIHVIIATLQRRQRNHANAN